MDKAVFLYKMSHGQTELENAMNKQAKKLKERRREEQLLQSLKARIARVKGE